MAYKKAKTIIECLSKVTLKNDIFGTFILEEGKFYDFNLATVGRDPTLKRNNLFISKKKIYQLIESGEIDNPQNIIEKIASKI